jgi:hypothetical protein
MEGDNILFQCQDKRYKEMAWAADIFVMIDSYNEVFDKTLELTHKNA